MGLIHKLRGFSIRKIVQVLLSLNKHGFTLLALLDFAKEISEPDISIQDDSENLSYTELYKQSVTLANFLNKNHNITSGSSVAILSSNSIDFVKYMFAVSGLGADLFLLNPRQNKDYFNNFIDNQKPDIIIGENSLTEKLTLYKIPFLSFDEMRKDDTTITLQKTLKRKRSNIIILSSGSNGKPKAEKRKISPLKYLNPLIDTVEKLRLRENRSVLISVPIFHGYGLAALFFSFFMAQKITLTKKFDPQNTVKLLHDGRIDCWIAVPLMIQKVFSLPTLPFNMVKNIISGGDTLSANSVSVIHKNSSAKIYNMYGTSETGVCTIATDEDLKRYPNTVGKTITGITTRIISTGERKAHYDKVGQLFVKCPWSSDNKKGRYTPTGDIFTMNHEGYYFYKGRHDDLIIIGGENIYPVELENVIYSSKNIQWVKARSIKDGNHVIKIHIDIVLNTEVDFILEEFLEWITRRVPNYMIPKSVTVLDTIPTIKLM